MQKSIIFFVVAALFIAVKSESAYQVKSVGDFYQKVKDAGKDKLVVVDFFSKSCGSCDYIAPYMESFAQKYATQIVVLKVDVDEIEELGRRFKVTSLPKTTYLKNGGLIAYELDRANPNKIELIINYLLTHK